MKYHDETYYVQLAHANEDAKECTGSAGSAALHLIP